MIYDAQKNIFKNDLDLKAFLFLLKLNNIRKKNIFRNFS